MSGNKLDEISFGEWLRQRRHILDLTQQELADQAGCARITLRRIESGALKPSKELAAILLEKLGTPEEEREAWLRFARGLAGFPERFTDSIASKPLTNLPAPLTTFIGREKEQSEIIKLIGKYRLVTLVGTGGIGKTRLALKVAEQVLGDYPHGVWLVELAPLFDPTLVPRTTALAVGLRDEPQRPVIDMLSDYLREKKLLIILDNCEHLLNACAQLADTLLKECPSLKIFTTSREALGILGEATYPVSSLGLPDFQQTFEELSDYESVRLFEERAQLAKMDFLLTEENVSAIANICKQLSGIPLAIELAAARIKMFTPEQITERLSDQFKLLTGGSRTALPRHQRLQAAIDWSYDLLSPTEQTLFRRLSVFVNGWTFEAAEFVCSDTNIKSEDVLDLLTQLVNKSLVYTEEIQSQTRYHVLEIIRQYANQKLKESDENKLLRDHHLNYYLNLAETAAPHLIRPEQLEWLARLDTDYDNLRTALGWTLSKDPPELSLRLCAALGRFWLIRCYWIEGSKWLAKALAKPTKVLTTVEKVVYVRALYHDAELADHLDNVERLKASAELSLNLAQENVDKRDLAIARFFVGLNLLRHGDYSKARQLMEHSISEFKELNDPYWESYAYNRGVSLFLLSQTDHHYYEATEHNLELARKAGERLNLANSLLQYARWFYNFRQLENAQQYQEEANNLFEQIGSKISSDTRLFADIAWLNGNIQEARSYYIEMQERFGLLGEKNVRSAVIASLGILEMEEGNLKRAQTYLEQALALAKEIENQMFVARRLAELGNLFYLQGHVERSRQYLQESVSLAKSGSRFQRAIILLLMLKPLCFQNLENSVQLLGVLHNFQTENQRPINPLQYRYCERVWTYAQKTLSDALFHANFKKGQELSLDEALDLASKTLAEL
jgi:predicted ATPase/DNA-binding XRE family transcriptional regulator